MSTAINWAAALLIVAIYAGMQNIDLGPSDHATQQAQEQDLQDAIKNEAQEARYARANAAIAAEQAQQP